MPENTQPVQEGTVSLDDPRVEKKNRDFKKGDARTFRVEEGKVYRIRLLTDQAVMRLRHYDKLAKKYLRCLAAKGYCPACLSKKESCKRASESYGLNIWVWKTDAEGAIVDPPDGAIHFWAFGSDKFVGLRSIKKEWGDLTKIDLKVTPTDVSFQRMDIQPCKTSPTDNNPQLLARMLKALKDDGYPVDKFLCKEVDPIKMVELYGLEPELAIPPKTERGVDTQKAASTVANQQQQPPPTSPAGSNPPPPQGGELNYDAEAQGL
jgi:hypothetical protein